MFKPLLSFSNLVKSNKFCVQAFTVLFDFSKVKRVLCSSLGCLTLVKSNEFSVQAFPCSTLVKSNEFCVQAFAVLTTGWKTCEKHVKSL